MSEATPTIQLTKFPFAVGSVTASGLGDWNTAFNLWKIAEILQKPLACEFTGGIGVAEWRTHVVRSLTRNISKLMLKDITEPYRGLLIDGDIVIPDSQILNIADHIRYADDHNLNIVAPVKMRNGKWNVCKTLDKNSNYSTEELRMMKDFSRVRIAGLAFYYGTIHPTYRFHSGGDSLYGEDWSYFIDNRIALNLAKLVVYHRELVDLGDPSILGE